MGDDDGRRFHLKGLTAALQERDAPFGDYPSRRATDRRRLIDLPDL